MFRTEVMPLPFDEKIHLNSNIVSFGSCFADSMGNRFSENKLNILVNPFGIIYNPLSINALIYKSIAGEAINLDGFLERDGLWYHEETHSKLQANSKGKLNDIISRKLEDTTESIQNANWMMITLGTSIVYETFATKRIVANCHKIPASEFKKRLLTTTEIINSFSKLYQQIKSINPTINFIFTISPVRHIKDTIQLNSVSKATLLLAVYELAKNLQDVFYFPAYEIMLDDLRDYRFYKDDMLHPSTVAEDYIWQKFSAVCFDTDLLTFENKWSKIKKSLAHKPFNETSSKHQVFLKKLLKDLENLKHQVNVDREIEEIKRRIL